MKLNKNKIIVSALALAIGGSLAGSVGSTVAWYQYSTRANVSYVGEASGVSSNLQMRFVGEADTAWRTRITWQEMNTKLGDGMKIVPMTFGALGKDAELPDRAKELYERVRDGIIKEGVPCQTGVFGAHMVINQVQMGPLTFVFEC